jgi:hypothetical protein
MPTKKLTYETLTAQNQYETARQTLIGAEQQHYALTLQNPVLNNGLDDQIKAAEDEVVRLQKIVAAAQKAAEADAP